MDFIFEITRATDSIRLDFTNVDLGVDLGLNSFEVYIASTKRTVRDYYIRTANVWGEPCSSSQTMPQHDQDTYTASNGVHTPLNRDT